VFEMAVEKRKSADKIATGITHKHTQTKHLLRTISPNSIAVIYHHDLDDLAAEGLIRARVQLVVNAGKTMSGKVPLLGPLMILEQGIPIVEIDPCWFSAINDGCQLSLLESGLLMSGQIIPCTVFTRNEWLQSYQKALSSFPGQLPQFIDNSLAFARLEKELVLTPIRYSGLRTRLAGRPVVVVIRGKDFVKDLRALRPYIKHRKPVLIGVDGGADALLEHGHKPDLIVGDMDSVSNHALHCGAELIVHAYANGNAPGLGRIEQLGLSAHTLYACGTSEDLALLLAYDHDCEIIVTIGAHSHMQDFVEKGRQGMGSTLLVRMKVGSKLVDAKGFHMLLKSAESGGLGSRIRRRLTSWLKS
jgi:uncharacterized membrane-anchored protein